MWSPQKCETLVNQATRHQNYTYDALQCCDSDNKYSKSHANGCSIMHAGLTFHSQKFMHQHGYHKSPDLPSETPFCKRVQACNDQKSKSNGFIPDGSY